MAQQTEVKVEGEVCHRSRARRLVAAAAAVVVMGGLALVLTRRSPATSISRGDATTTLIDPSSASTSNQIAMGSVPEPDRLAVLDPALGLGEPTREDPWQRWLHDDATDTSAEFIAQWFVRTTAEGEPSGGLVVWHQPTGGWENASDLGTSVDLGVGVEARQFGDHAQFVAWRTAAGVMRMEGTGDVSSGEVVAAARLVADSNGAALAIDGFEPVTVPRLVSNTIYWNHQVSVGLYSADALDVRSWAFLRTGWSPTPAGTGWVVTDSGGSTNVFVHLEGLLYANVGYRMVLNPAIVADSLLLVDPTTVAVGVPPGMGPPATAVAIGGEVPSGRWVLYTWTNGDQHTCWWFSTSFAAEGGTCMAQEHDPSCWASKGMGSDSGWHYTLLARGRFASVVAIVDEVEVTPATVEFANGYSLAIGHTTKAPAGDLRVLLDGTPHTCWRGSPTENVFA